MNPRNDAKSFSFSQTLMRVGFIISFLLFLGGCEDTNKKEVPSKVESTPLKSTQTVPNQSTSTLQPQPQLLKASVVSVESGGGYSFLELKNTDGNNFWIASTKVQAKKGDIVQYRNGPEIRNFKSRSLKREFDKIILTLVTSVNGIPVANISNHGLQQNEKGATVDGNPHTESKDKVLDPDIKKIEIGSISKAKGGNTIAELLEQPSKFAGKTVKIRAKVVKFFPNIMGKNWIHLQDGSATDKTNTLIATSSETATLGDLLLVEGKVAVDKTLAAGYKYDVLIEEANLTIE